jgi:hypothetical protein
MQVLGGVCDSPALSFRVCSLAPNLSLPRRTGRKVGATDSRVWWICVAVCSIARHGMSADMTRTAQLAQAQPRAPPMSVPGRRCVRVHVSVHASSSSFLFRRRACLHLFLSTFPFVLRHSLTFLCSQARHRITDRFFLCSHKARKGSRASQDQPCLKQRLCRTETTSCKHRPCVRTYVRSQVDWSRVAARTLNS